MPKGLKGLWKKNKNATKPQSTGMQGEIFLNRCMYPENLFSGNHGGQKKKVGHLTPSDAKPFPRLWGQIGDPIVPSTSSTYPWRKYLNLFCVYTILIKPKQKFAKGLKGLSSFFKNTKSRRMHRPHEWRGYLIPICPYMPKSWTCSLFIWTDTTQYKFDTKPFQSLSGPVGFLYHLVQFMLGRLL